MPNREKNSPLITVSLAALIVAGVHLTLFSFRLTEDSPCWIGVGQYFIGRETISRVSPHCFFSPLIPWIASVISQVFGLSVADSYLPLNLAALIGSGFLIYRIGEALSYRSLAMIAAFIFLVDFHTQYYGFAVMPDAVTWFFELLLIWLACKVWSKQQFSETAALLSGNVGGLAILTKMNLGFLLPLIPIGLFRGLSHQKFQLITLYLVSVFLFPGLLYVFGFSMTGTSPWDSFQVGLQNQTVSLDEHLQALVSAFLYTTPLILIGLRHHPYQRDKLRFLITTGGLLVIPILIWPYAMSRFSFSLFPLLLPLAASGLWQLAVWIAPTPKLRPVIIGCLLVALFMMGLLRMQLTFSNQTHLEFFYELMRSLQRNRV